MAKTTIKKNIINDYLRLKEKQLEIKWGAAGKVSCHIAKKPDDFGSILAVVVTSKRSKSFYSACSLEEPYDSQVAEVGMALDMLEKAIHNKIIYLFFNNERKSK